MMRLMPYMIMTGALVLASACTQSRKSTPRPSESPEPAEESLDEDDDSIFEDRNELGSNNGSGNPTSSARTNTGTNTNTNTNTGSNTNTNTGTNTNTNTGTNTNTNTNTNVTPSAQQLGLLVDGWAGDRDLAKSGLRYVSAEAGALNGQQQPTASGGSSAGNAGGGNSGGGNTNTAVTYTNRIKAIIDANCISCHVAGGSRRNSPLDSFSGVDAFKSQVVSRVRSGNMPQNGSLSQAEKDAFEAWESGGFQN